MSVSDSAPSEPANITNRIRQHQQDINGVLNSPSRGRGADQSLYQNLENQESPGVSVPGSKSEAKICRATRRARRFFEDPNYGLEPAAPAPITGQSLVDQIPEPLTPPEKLAQRGVSFEAGLSNTAYLAVCSGTQNLRLSIKPSSVKFGLSDHFDRVPLQSKPQSAGCKRGFITELSDASRNRLASKAADLQALGHIPEIMITLTSPANWEDLYVGVPIECSNEPICNSDLIFNSKSIDIIKPVNYIAYDCPYSNYLCSSKVFAHISAKNAFITSIEGGREFKRHMSAFRKRLDVKLKELMIDNWSALWFLEFQKRGAPHIHMMIFNCNVSTENRIKLRNWCGKAWAEVVGNPVQEEFEKHVGAGTRVEKMRKKHFGYAMKYASKMEQKQVPSEFRKVGRFWGVWNVKFEPPIEIDLEFNRFEDDDVDYVMSMVLNSLSRVYEHSEHFVSSRWRRFCRALQNGIRSKFAFTVYGEDITEFVLGELK